MILHIKEHREQFFSICSLSQTIRTFYLVILGLLGIFVAFLPKKSKKRVSQTQLKLSDPYFTYLILTKFHEH